MQKYKDLLTINLKTGISFPKARAKALDEYFKKYNLDYSLDINSNKYAKYPSDITSNSNLDINTFINQPNNILGIEYIKALMRFNSKINPVPLKRLGAGYHSLDTRTKLASATGIPYRRNKSGLIKQNSKQQIQFYRHRNFYTNAAVKELHILSYIKSITTYNS